MTNRFDKVFCGYCKRSLPRAAIQCVWCLRPIRSTDYGRPQERSRSQRSASPPPDVAPRGAHNHD